MFYVKNPKYLEENKKERKSRDVEARKVFVQFRAPRILPRGDSRKHELRDVANFRNMKAAKKLFVAYCETLAL